MIDTPAINLVVDQNGSTGWSGKGDAIDEAVAQNSAPGEPLHVVVSNGTLKVLDERNGQSFAVDQITADLAFDRTGTLDMTGSAAIAQQFTTIESHVASLPRLSDDGTPFDLSLKAPALAANFSGRLSLREALSLAGTFTAESDNAGALLHWLGGSKPLEKFTLPVSASGPIDLTGRIFKSSDVGLTIGDMAFKGKIGVDASGFVPLVTGQLSTDALKLALPAPQPAAAAEANSKQPVSGPQQFDLSALKTVDADINLSAFSAVLGPLELGSTTLTAQGKGGRYDISLAETSLFGGMGSGTLHLDGSGATPQAGLKFSGTGLDFGKLMAATGVGSWLSGTGDLSLDVNGAGKSSEELISTLQGKSSMSLPQGDIKGFDVASSIQQAASALINGWVSRADASTAITNLTADFTLKDGIATTEGSNATLAGVDVAMVGDVDMLRRAVDLRLTPAKGSSGVPLAVRVVGPWEKPKLKADLSDALGIPGAEVDGKDVQKAAKKAKKFLKKVIGN